MSFKEDLLRLGHRQDAMILSDQEIRTKIDNTISKTFGWMAAMLLIAFGMARGISTGILPIPFSGPLYLGSAIAGLIVILVMSRRRQKMTYQTLAALLLVFALLEGYGLTGVFLIYDLGSIYQVFLVTALMFAGLAGAGWYFKVDVARVGPILMIGLVSIIIASLINLFRQNQQFDIRISVIGVLIFSGLIIYDMNILKQQALINDERIPLLMSLGLFLNFINLFLFLLRLFGGGKSD